MTIWTFQNDHSKGKKEQRRRGKTVSMSATKVQNPGEGRRGATGAAESSIDIVDQLFCSMEFGSSLHVSDCDNAKKLPN